MTKKIIKYILKNIHLSIKHFKICTQKLKHKYMVVIKMSIKLYLLTANTDCIYTYPIKRHLKTRLLNKQNRLQDYVNGR